MDVSLKDLQNPQTVASATAVVAVCALGVYQQRQINEMRQDIAEMKQHLAMLIGNTDEGQRARLENVIGAVKEINSTLQTHERTLNRFAGVLDDTPPGDIKIQKWVRFTKTSAPEEPVIGVRLKEQTNQQEEEDVAAAEVAAMQ